MWEWGVSLKVARAAWAGKRVQRRHPLPTRSGSRRRCACQAHRRTAIRADSHHWSRRSSRGQHACLTPVDSARRRQPDSPHQRHRCRRAGSGRKCQSCHSAHRRRRCSPCPSSRLSRARRGAGSTSRRRSGSPHRRGTAADRTLHTDACDTESCWQSVSMRADTRIRRDTNMRARSADADQTVTIDVAVPAQWDSHADADGAVEQTDTSSAVAVGQAVITETTGDTDVQANCADADQTVAIVKAGSTQRTLDTDPNRAIEHAQAERAVRVSQAAGRHTLATRTEIACGAVCVERAGVRDARAAGADITGGTVGVDGARAWHAASIQADIAGRAVAVDGAGCRRAVAVDTHIAGGAVGVQGTRAGHATAVQTNVASWAVCVERTRRRGALAEDAGVASRAIAVATDPWHCLRRRPECGRAGTPVRTGDRIRDRGCRGRRSNSQFSI